MLAKAWDAFVAEWGATMLVPNTRAQVPFPIAHVEPHDRLPYALNALTLR
jgi:hypothetical protein